MRSGSGIVYLLHFNQPFHHARHYVGFCESDLARRINLHRRGQSGAKLMAALKRAGISFTLARTWIGDRDFERKLHKRHNSPARLCPLCRGCKPQLEHETAA